VKKSAPRFEGLTASSPRASAIKKRVTRHNTKPELRLRRALFAEGLRYRLHARHLPGRPDIVFPRARVAVFCDGDFWHGRNWRSRRQKLARGSNSSYWIAKIHANMLRDRRHDRELAARGWLVVRIWETDIVSDPTQQVKLVLRAVRTRARRGATRRSTRGRDEKVDAVSAAPRGGATRTT
jgi:DNA mismatch endonuclease, patch repair protein